MTKLVDFVKGLGWFTIAIYAFFAYAAIHGALYGCTDNPERASAYREFQKDCLRIEMRGRDLVDVSKSEREEIATRCARLSKDFYRDYGK